MSTSTYQSTRCQTQGNSPHFTRYTKWNPPDDISLSLLYHENYESCSQNYEKRPLASSCLSVRQPLCPSVRIEKLSCHTTVYHEIWYLNTFRKSIDKNYVSLKLDKNKFLIISRSVVIRMRISSEKRCRENQNTRFLFE